MKDIPKQYMAEFPHSKIYTFDTNNMDHKCGSLKPKFWHAIYYGNINIVVGLDDNWNEEVSNVVQILQMQSGLVSCSELHRQYFAAKG